MVIAFTPSGARHSFSLISSPDPVSMAVTSSSSEGADFCLITLTVGWHATSAKWRKDTSWVNTCNWNKVFDTLSMDFYLFWCSLKAVITFVVNVQAGCVWVTFAYLNRFVIQVIGVKQTASPPECNKLIGDSLTRALPWNDDCVLWEWISVEQWAYLKLTGRLVVRRINVWINQHLALLFFLCDLVSAGGNGAGSHNSQINHL